MPVLVELSPGPLPWLVRATPRVYSEAGRQQLHGMPGVHWVRDTSSANGRGFYEGPVEALQPVLALLQAAGVVHVKGRWPQQQTTTPLSDTTDGLRDYQAVGAGWIADALWSSGAALLADEMGIGKTAQAIRGVEAAHTAAGPKLVIAPAIAIPHWRGQLARWSRDPAAWSLTSFDKLRNAIGKAAKAGVPLVRPAVVVIDEMQYLANPKAKRTIAINDWLHDGTAPLIVGLTGTPINSEIQDLWSPLNILWPGRFGSWFDFTRRYAGGQWVEVHTHEGSRRVWTPTGLTYGDELAARLRACVLRRTKADVALELPPRSRVVTEIEIPTAARRDLARAQAATNWREDARTGVSSLLSQVEAYKIDAAEELARNELAAGHRVLLLTTRKETAHELGRRLGAPVATGDDAAETRRAILADVACGVATMYSVTTAIDLVGFDTVIFTGLDWVPAVLLQAEARVHRLGQDWPVTIYYLVGLGTIDEVVRARVIDRLDMLAAVTGEQRGDATDFSGDLAGGSEDELIAQLVRAAEGKR